MKRQGFSVLLGMGVLYLLIGVLLFGFFSGAQNRNKLLQQYQLEQALAQMLTLLQFNPDIEIAQGRGDLPFQITGFAIYDQEGNAIFIRGQAPGSLSMDYSEPREDLVHNQDLNRVVYIRRFSPGFTGRSPEDPGIRDTPPPYQGFRTAEPLSGTISWTQLSRRPTGMYIEAIPHYRANPLPYSWKTFGIIMGLLSIGFLFFGHTFLKNQHYRRVLVEQENLVTLGEAARTISHEIKNPLSAISLRLTILQAMNLPDSQEDLTIIQQEVQRLDRLASKIGHFLNNPRGTPENISVIPFIQNLTKRFPRMVSLVEPALDQGSGHDTSSLEPHVWIDPDHFRSILENILINGLESLEPQKEDGPILIELQRKKHYLLIHTTDRGQGIAQELGDKIFKPFVTTKTRGSGFGLAIARRFAEAAGGKIEWRPNPHGGTIMTVHLPEYHP